jgi:hypothetical protein
MFWSSLSQTQNEKLNRFIRQQCYCGAHADFTGISVRSIARLYTFQERDPLIIFGIAHEFLLLATLAGCFMAGHILLCKGFSTEGFSVKFLQIAGNSPGGAWSVRVLMSLEQLCGCIPRWARLSQEELVRMRRREEEEGHTIQEGHTPHGTDAAFHWREDYGSSQDDSSYRRLFDTSCIGTCVLDLRVRTAPDELLSTFHLDLVPQARRILVKVSSQSRGCCSAD